MSHTVTWAAVLATCLAIMIGVFIVAGFACYEARAAQRKLKAKRPKVGKITRELELDEFEDQLS